MNKFLFLILAILTFSELSNARTLDFNKIKDLVNKEQWSDLSLYTKEFLTKEDSNSQADLTHLLRGIALERQGQFEETIIELQSIGEQSLYYQWSKILLMKMSLQIKNNELLKTSLMSVEKFELKGERNWERHFYNGQLNMNLKKWSIAAQIFQKIEKYVRNSDLEIPTLEALAISLFESGKIINVCKVVSKLYTKYPLHPWFSEGAPELKSIPMGKNKLSCRITEKEFEIRLKRLNLLGENSKAEFELNKWFSISAVTPRKQILMKAQQLVSSNHADEALEILKKEKDSKINLKILVPLSYAAAKMGDMKTAIETSLRVYDLSPHSKIGTTSLYQASVWSYQIRDYKNAEVLFKKIKSERLTKAKKREVQWYLGWIKYLNGDYLASENQFKEMLRTKLRDKNKESSDRIVYWLGMSKLRQGKPDLANVHFEKLAKKSKLSYYSILSQERLKNLPKITVESVEPNSNFTVKSIFNGPFPTPYGENGPKPTVFENELLAEQGTDEENDETGLISEDQNQTESGDIEDSNELSPTLITFSHLETDQKLERAKIFMSIGLENMARAEINDLDRFSRNLDYFKKIVEEYRQLGLFNKITALGQNFSTRADFKSNRFIYEAIYPKAFSDLVIKSATENSLPPALIWGIMKAESMYRPWVKSPVGAMGLMQVMPFTGRKIAELLDDKKFTPQILLQPSEAIRYGSKYLERLSKKFDRSIPLVAAAYNAGPHRVTQWLYYFGFMQMDEWVEHIPYLETRNYVKKVTVTYLSYQKIYGNDFGESLALTDPVPVQIAGVPETKENWD